VRRRRGEWKWQEDDPSYTISHGSLTLAETTQLQASSGSSMKPKQSLGQNYLRDGNTVNKILRAFHADAMTVKTSSSLWSGPGASALTDKQVEALRHGYSSVPKSMSAPWNSFGETSRFAHYARGRTAEISIRNLRNKKISR
jgi:hypothetical protein